MERKRPSIGFEPQSCSPVVGHSVCLTLCNTMDCSPPGSSVHGIFQARILEWVAMPSSRGSSQLRVKPRSPTLQANSLPSEIPGKPKNTGVGSLSLLQGILLTQGSNRGLLPCRWMLYQLSYQESPKPKSYAHSISRTLCTGLPAICT